MPTYDVPDVGRVSVTIDRHEFGNSNAVLRTLGNVYDEAGALLSLEASERVDRYLKSIGVVD